MSYFVLYKKSQNTVLTLICVKKEALAFLSVDIKMERLTTKTFRQTFQESSKPQRHIRGQRLIEEVRGEIAIQ